MPENIIKPKPAAPTTLQRNLAALANLPLEDGKDFEYARRGFIASHEPLILRSADGSRTVWDMTQYDFLAQEQPPDTVHPSLWRQARLNAIHGLFEVVPGLYQVRGYDLSNLTIVEGATGVILIDTLVSAEAAAAALQLYFVHRGRRPIKALIYTHSHSDHFAGARGLLTNEDAARIPIIAPEGFLREAISENLFAGHAMARRAVYFSGAMLPKGERGQVDAGLGKSVSTGQVSLIAPNDHIQITGEKRVLDGIEFVFLMAPETEAPAEMLFHIPAFSALCLSEVVTPTMHNIYTPRGAQVRNAMNWWKAIDGALTLFGSGTDVVFAQHHWPRWGRSEITAYLEKQRDLYKFMHDQTLRSLNRGLKPAEIAEELVLPQEISSEWHCSGYYGTLKHNAKGIYQRYLGWYDAHPANLDPHPPKAAAQRYVEFMGGADDVVRKSRTAFAQGDFRWVVEVLAHVVRSAPEHREAQLLQADAMEQLGYQSESAAWRNMYLAAAFELRNGVMTWSARKAGNPDQIREMSTEMLLDYLGIRWVPDAHAGARIRMSLHLHDTGQDYDLQLANGVLGYRAGRSGLYDVELSMTRAQFNDLVFNGDAATNLAEVVVAGDAGIVRSFLGRLDRFSSDFAIV